MRKWRNIASVPGFLLLLCGCSASNAPPKESPAKALQNEQAPASYRVSLDTSKGPVVLEITRAWAPLGADRFYNLVRGGFYDGARFFRVLPNFVVQFGINGDPAVSRLWSNMTFPDDPVKESNRTGAITFATRGPASRTTQVFINKRDNRQLDRSGFAPFGRVISGMEEVVEHLYAGYGEMAPNGSGPNPTQIQIQGNAYLEDRFPRLDFIRKARIEK